jgi:hypothetical protein
VLVEHAQSLAALVDDRAELVGEAGRFERDLAVLLVDVERPPCVRVSVEGSAS